jgi:hypothetical protein
MENGQDLSKPLYLPTFSLQELQSKPTLAVSQADNLKIERPYYRVWLSRCTVEDGEPYNNKVTVERRVGNHWLVVSQYPAIILEEE